MQLFLAFEVEFKVTVYASAPLLIPHCQCLEAVPGKARRAHSSDVFRVPPPWALHLSALAPHLAQGTSWLN